MRRTNLGSLGDATIEALASTDYELAMTAANLLRGATGQTRELAAEALLASFRRITDFRSDTARDVRVALLDRMGELLTKDQAITLMPIAQSDFDPDVRAAAGRAYEKLTGDPVGEFPSIEFRYPFQPTAAELNALPTRAVIDTAVGQMELVLFVDQAPITIARFVRLARAGFYRGSTFHRVVPNFVVQGGSPNANEYSGDSRYMRDETGAPHLRGSIGISTRGRDTGDGQIFIDLVDLPRLDHQYTVFAQVLTGYDVLDQILEGTVIRNVTFK
jgi:cyclophilin family peptidyl-prolyl cis-trans isomerase